MSGGDHDSYADQEILDILGRVRSIAVVGASPKSSRPSYFVTKYLLSKGYDVLPVNPGHAGKVIAGVPVFGRLSDIDRPVDMVDVFRASEMACRIAEEAVAIGAKVLWMQLGIRNDAAAKLAEAAGLKVIMNRCPKIEYGHLSGEIGWTGVNSGVLSSRRPVMAPRGTQTRILSIKR